MGTLRMIEIKCRIVITIVAILDDLHPPTLCKTLVHSCSYDLVIVSRASCSRVEPLRRRIRDLPS